MNVSTVEAPRYIDENEPMANEEELSGRWVGWGLVGALWLLVVTIGGFVITNQSAHITELERRVSAMGERISSLETAAVRLGVIEGKLDGLRDALMELKGKR